MAGCECRRCRMPAPIRSGRGISVFLGTRRDGPRSHDPARRLSGRQHRQAAKRGPPAPLRTHRGIRARPPRRRRPRRRRPGTSAAATTPDAGRGTAPIPPIPAPPTPLSPHAPERAPPACRRLATSAPHPYDAAPRMARRLAAPRRGRVAQLVEQGIENPRVGGSIPSPATMYKFKPRKGFGLCGAFRFCRSSHPALPMISVELAARTHAQNDAQIVLPVEALARSGPITQLHPSVLPLLIR